MGTSTTPGGINPNPRTMQDHVRNWQRLAAWLQAGIITIDDNGSLTINIDAGTLVNFNGALAADTQFYTASGTISGDKVVCVTATNDVAIADASTVVAGSVVGISRQGVASGAQVAVQSAGRVTGLTGLTPAAVYYLGTAGALTATPPASGVVQPMGVALNATTLVLVIGVPVQRA